jgi:hypothetical protein
LARFFVATEDLVRELARLFFAVVIARFPVDLRVGCAAGLPVGFAAGLPVGFAAGLLAGRAPCAASLAPLASTRTAASGATASRDMRRG